MVWVCTTTAIIALDSGEGTEHFLSPFAFFFPSLRWGKVGVRLFSCSLWPFESDAAGVLVL